MFDELVPVVVPLLKQQDILINLWHKFVIPQEGTQEGGDTHCDHPLSVLLNGA